MSRPSFLHLNDTRDDTQDDTAFASPSGFAATAGSSAGPSTGAPTALYLIETGTSTAISVTDLHQGQIGDCYLISSIGEIALTKPADIASMIHGNADGTETVTLYADRSGHAINWGTTSFKPVAITVSNVFPNYAVNNGATQDMLNGIKEIWPAVLEKAVAQLDGGYAAIAYGGNPVLAMETLTGRPATFLSPSSLTVSALQADIAANDMIVFDTKNTPGLAYGLVGNHAYMFQSLTMSNGTPMVKLLNPWGSNQPAPIPLSQVRTYFAEIDVGHAA